ncbi:MAG: hypothetical protein ABIE25_03290 [Thermoplasmatota archaeon]
MTQLDECHDNSRTLGCRVSLKTYEEFHVAGISLGLINISDTLRLAVERFVEDCAQGKVNALSPAAQAAYPHVGNGGGVDRECVLHGQDVAGHDEDGELDAIKRKFEREVYVNLSRIASDSGRSLGELLGELIALIEAAARTVDRSGYQ